MHNSLPTLHDYDEDVNKLRRNFLSLSDLEYGSQEFNSRRVRLLAKWVSWNNRDEDWKNANLLFKGLFAAVALLECFKDPSSRFQGPYFYIWKDIEDLINKEI